MAELAVGGSRGSRIAVAAATIAAAWLVAGSLLATQGWVSRALRGDPVTWGQAFGVWLSWAAIGGALTPISLALAARFPIERPRPGRALAVHGTAAVATAAAHLAIYALLVPTVDAANVAPGFGATYSQVLGRAFLLNIPAYWIVVGAAQALRWARAARERERRALRLEGQLAETRLEALRSQLQPHFLFNALNTVSVLMREDVDAADRVLVALSRLLRRALEVAAVAEVALRDEVAFLEAYLEIERARFGGALIYRIDIAPALLEARVPGFVLQPLVENAIHHGLAARQAGEIRIGAVRVGDRLELSVRDDGPGLVGVARQGVGLANIRSRLGLLYGERQEIALKKPSGGGLLVTVALPFHGVPAGEGNA